jgi:predicted enzyme related to lactoylglutathione lyase
MTARLTNIVVDCDDALLVARFWSAVLDRPLADDPAPSAEFASLRGTDRESDGGPNWLFAKVPEPKTAKNRMHVDLVTEDRDSEVARLVDMGARHVVDKDEWGVAWVVMTDPEGNEFCVAQA